MKCPEGTTANPFLIKNLLLRLMKIGVSSPLQETYI
jgi:hypothetical protein